MRRTIIATLLIVIAVFAIAGGAGYWFWNNYNYYSTDDALVTGQSVSLSSPAAGQLTTYTVKQGDTVTAGQTVATITPATTTAPATTGTTGTAAEPKTINVTSPISGTIVQSTGVQGQNVTPGASLLQVSDLSNLTVTAYVDENTFKNIKTNQDVDVTVDAYKDTSLDGHIDRIVQSAASQFSLLPTTDYASGNFTKVGQRIPVVVKLNTNGGNNIVPGMSAEVRIHIH